MAGWRHGSAAVLGASALMLAGSGTATASTASYTYSQVTVNAGGKPCSNVSVNSITKAGAILGDEYCTSDQSSRGYILRNGKTTVFHAPGKHVDTEAAGISSNGKYIVVDTQHNFTGRWAAYLKVGHAFHKLADPKAGKNGTNAEGVNNHRVVVGYYYTGNGQTHGHPFVYRSGKFHSLRLGIRGASNIAAIDINDKGVIAGYYQDKRHRVHGFLKAPGKKARTINAPGAGHGKHLGTVVDGVANNGTYCGSVIERRGPVTSSTTRGYVHRRGLGYISIKLPALWGAHDAGGDTCNNSGVVAGSYIHNLGGSQWERMGYVARPLP